MISAAFKRRVAGAYKANRTQAGRGIYRGCAGLLDRMARSFIIPLLFYAGVAQLVERNLAKVEVESSRLFSRSTNTKGKPEPLPFFINETCGSNLDKT